VQQPPSTWLTSASLGRRLQGLHGTEDWRHLQSLWLHYTRGIWAASGEDEEAATASATAAAEAADAAEAELPEQAAVASR
jgi:hypothetical protein